MRLLNGDTRLLMLDEPTSALDSIAERELFERFREKSRGKTAIFVTHRFANLAKRADLIVYVFFFLISRRFCAVPKKLIFLYFKLYEEW